MPYTPNPTWADGSGGGTPITAAKLNVIEAGIVAAIPKDVATTKGDLLAASAAATVARLGVGTDGQVLVADAAQTLGVKWAYPPGYRFAYNQITSPVSITATTEATANTVVTASAVTFDGSTVVCVEFYTPFATSSATGLLVVVLYDGSSSIGFWGQEALISNGMPMTLHRTLTPSAAAHTYSVRAYITGGTGSISAGAGGAAAYMPAFIKITKEA